MLKASSSLQSRLEVKSSNLKQTLMANLISQFLGGVSTKSNATVEMEGDCDSNGAFVTLLTNDNFYPGADALCKSIKATITGIDCDICCRKISS